MLSFEVNNNFDYILLKEMQEFSKRSWICTDVNWRSFVADFARWIISPSQVRMTRYPKKRRLLQTKKSGR